MKLLFKTLLILSLGLSVGCSNKSDQAQEQAAGENAAQEESEEAAAVEAAPDEATDEAALGEAKPAEPSTKLESVEWVVKDIAGTAVLDDTAPTLVFGKEEGDKVTGKASCNTYFGTYESSDDTLEISDTGMTRMACPDPEMKQEQAFMEALNKVDGYKIDDKGDLRLSAGEDVVLTAQVAE